MPISSIYCVQLWLFLQLCEKKIWLFKQLIRTIHHCQIGVTGRSYLSNSLLIFLPFCWHIWGMELSHLGDKPYNSTESIANSWPFFIIKDWKNRSPRVIFQCYISSVLREGSRTLTIIVEQWLILWKVRTDSSQTKNILLFKSIGCDQKKFLCVHACTRKWELRMLSNSVLKHQQCLDIVLIVLTPCNCT